MHVLWQQGRHGEAVDVLRGPHASLFTIPADWLRVLGAVLMDAGRFEEAARCFEQLLGLRWVGGGTREGMGGTRVGFRVKSVPSHPIPTLSMVPRLCSADDWSAAMGLLDALLLSPLLLSLSPHTAAPSTAAPSPPLAASTLRAWLAAVLTRGSDAISSGSGSGPHTGSGSSSGGGSSNGQWESQPEREGAARAAEAVSVRIKALPAEERDALLEKVRGSRSYSSRPQRVAHSEVRTERELQCRVIQDVRGLSPALSPTNECQSVSDRETS